jgi:zinc D-Ala-D-Ala dipeptidase
MNRQTLTNVDRRLLVKAGMLLPVASVISACSNDKPEVTPNTVAADVVPVRGGKAGLVELVKLDPTIKLDLRYATTNNFTGRVLYNQARAFMVDEAAKALVRAHRKAAAGGRGLAIFDAYRPWAVTKQLWDATEPAKRDYVANPKRGSRHNRGCAVDLTLFSLASGTLLDMPTGFDDFSTRAHRDYAGGTAQQTSNRGVLESLMVAEGFLPMSNEWWHFDYGKWEQYPVLDIAFEDI